MASARTADSRLFVGQSSLKQQTARLSVKAPVFMVLAVKWSLAEG
jgi:hypothetical protein